MMILSDISVKTMDALNRCLLRSGNVFKRQFKTKTSFDFDVIVIGGGHAGLILTQTLFI